MGKNTVNCSNCPDRGMCCRYVVLPLARALTDDEVKWVELHGSLDIVGENVKIWENCGALDEQGRCTLYNTPRRPQLCAVWPDDPDNQAPPGCLYRISGSGQGVKPL